MKSLIAILFAAAAMAEAADTGTWNLKLGETSATAYRGDRGKTAYDHTSLTNNPHAVTKAQIGLANAEDKTSDSIRAELTSANVTTALGYTPATNARTINGHALTANVTVSKYDVGLASVDDTPDTGKPVSTAQQTALDLRCLKSNNLSDLSSAATARTNLGLGTAATTAATAYATAAQGAAVDSATNANTASAIVKRDASGNFSAGTITANLTGNASGSSGSCTGNAATATLAANSSQLGGVAAASYSQVLTADTTIYFGVAGKTTATVSGAVSSISGVNLSPLSSHRVAYYTMDAGNNDSYGRYNLSAPDGGNGSMGGKHNNATSLQVDCCLTNTAYPDSDFTDKCASLWFYFDLNPTAMVRLFMGDGDTGFSIGSTYLRLYANGSYTGNTATVSLSTNTWHHALFSYKSATSTIDLYIDGTLQCTANTAVTHWDNGLKIVADFDSIAVDEMALFNVAGSADIATALYNGGSGKFYEFIGVGIPAPAHTFAVGDSIQADSSVNYNGAWTVDSATTTDTVVIVDTYTAETLASAQVLYRQPVTAATVNAQIETVPKNLNGHYFYARPYPGYYPFDAAINFTNFSKGTVRLQCAVTPSTQNAQLQREVVWASSAASTIIVNNCDSFYLSYGLRVLCTSASASAAAFYSFGTPCQLYASSFQMSGTTGTCVYIDRGYLDTTYRNYVAGGAYGMQFNYCRPCKVWGNYSAPGKYPVTGTANAASLVVFGDTTKPAGSTTAVAPATDGGTYSPAQ